MSDKINPHHLARKAVLYVRQSSSYQVNYHEEGRRLQYAMRERLEQLGWEEIEVIDEDLGRSAAGNVERRGFERMVAEVCLGKVGAVAAREVSRFARNSREWQRLVEVCRIVDRFWCNFSREGRLGLFQLLLTRKALLPIPAGSWPLDR
jgi:hypothetical protein